MADFLKILGEKELAQISVQFDYKNATTDFIGLKLMPMVKTENMKVYIRQLMKGGDVPVIALVHAFDAEARIGDRPNYEEFRESLFLIKEKINQGEELRKMVKELGMSSDDASLLRAIYDDISNEIAKVLTAFERRACEALSTAKLVIDENGAKRTVDYNLAADNKIDFSSWSDPTHDIVADLAAIKNASRGKIVRQIVSSKILGYMLANEKIKSFAVAQLQPVTADYVKNYLKAALNIELIVDDRTFKTAYNGGKEYRFFDADTIISLTTLGEVGKTVMTSTPTEDAAMAKQTYGFIVVDQWTEHDPKTSWTMAEGVGLPVFTDINNSLYLSKITA